MSSVEDLGAAVLGAMFLSIGLAALALWGGGLSGRDRTALWFGLLVTLYGVRLSLDSASVRALAGMSLDTWRYVEALITYVILAPAALFTEALLGRGWRSSFRRLWQIAAACAPIAFAIDLLTRPGAAMWINTLLVPSFFAVVLAHLFALGPKRWPRDIQVLAAGGAVFGVAAVFQTVTGGGLLPALRPDIDFEPFAMLVFVGCLDTWWRRGPSPPSAG